MWTAVEPCLRLPALLLHEDTFSVLSQVSLKPKETVLMMRGQKPSSQRGFPLRLSDAVADAVSSG